MSFKFIRNINNSKRLLLDYLDSTIIKIGGNELSSTLSLLTVAEITQLATIDGLTITNDEWTIVSALDQQLTSNSDVSFKTITLQPNDTFEGAQVNWLAGIGFSDWTQDVFFNSMRLFTSSTLINTLDISNIGAGVISVSIDGNLSVANITTGLVNGFDVSSMDTNIATNTTNISSNDTDIATNSTNIATNTTNISSNSSNISSNSSNIASNDTDIAANVINIATNSSNIATNSTNIATNTTNISSNDTDILSLQTDLNGFPDSLKTLTAAEITQVSNINTNVISATQWSYISASNQMTNTSSNVVFETVSPQLIEMKDSDIRLYSQNQYYTVGFSAINSLSVASGLIRLNVDNVSNVHGLCISSQNAGTARDDSFIFSTTGNMTTKSDVVITLATLDNLNNVAGDITTNATNISTNTTNISANTTNISTNTTNISTNTSNITTNLNNINGNDTDIATNLAAIISNDTDIAYLLTLIISNDADIASNLAEINLYPALLKTLSDSIINQILNIGTLLLPLSQWTYLADMDQAVSTSDIVAFSAVRNTPIKLENNHVEYTLVSSYIHSKFEPVDDLGNAGGYIVHSVDWNSNVHGMIVSSEKAGTGRKDAWSFLSNGSFKTYDDTLITLATVNNLNITDADTKTNTTNISTNTTNISTNTTSISTNTTNITASQADIDGFDDTLKSLTSAEITQLLNINANVISALQWGYLGSTDQSLSTSSDVVFGKVSASSIDMDNDAILIYAGNDAYLIRFAGALDTGELLGAIELSTDSDNSNLHGVKFSAGPVGSKKDNFLFYSNGDIRLRNDTTILNSSMELLVGHNQRVQTDSNVDFKTVSVGVDDVSAGVIDIYGDSTNGNAEIKLHLGANFDTTLEHWSINTFENELQISSDPLYNGIVFVNGIVSGLTAGDDSIIVPGHIETNSNLFINTGDLVVNGRNTTITNASLENLSGLDQKLDTAASPTFAALTVDGTAALEYMDSGVYTATITNKVSFVSTTINNHPITWTRSGNYITCYAQMEFLFIVNVASGTFDIDLPLTRASNFELTTDCIGHGIGYNSLSNDRIFINVQAVVGTKRLQVQLNDYGSLSTAHNHTCNFSFRYELLSLI